MPINSSNSYSALPSYKPSLQKAIDFSNPVPSFASSPLAQDTLDIRFGADVHVSRRSRGGGGGGKKPNRNNQPGRDHTADDETTGAGSKKKITDRIGQQKLRDRKKALIKQFGIKEDYSIQFTPEEIIHYLKGAAPDSRTGKNRVASALNHRRKEDAYSRALQAAESLEVERAKSPARSVQTSLPSFTEGFSRFAIAPPPMQPVISSVPPPVPRATSPDGFRYSADGRWKIEKRNGVYDPEWIARTGQTPPPQ